MASTSIPFDRAAEFYDRTRALRPDEMTLLIDGIVRETRAAPSSRFLEIGIGTGRISIPLSQRGIRVTGIDLSLPMLQVLRGKAPDFPIAQADMTELPFPDAQFDAVLAIHVFHLVGAWRQALTEAARVLRPGGMILLKTTWHDPESPLLRITQEWERLAAARGIILQRPGTKDRAEIEAFLAGRGASHRQVLICAETRPVTVRAILENIRSRTWSSTWAAPDDIFQAVTDELEAWAAAQFDPDRQAPQNYRHELDIFEFLQKS